MRLLILIILCLTWNLAMSQPCTPSIIEIALDDVKDANIIKTNDGNYLVVGSQSKNKKKDNDLFMIKMDYNGSILWNQSLGDSFVVSCPKIMETKDGNYLILYNSQRSNLVKINNSGTILWNQTIDPSEYINLEDILEETNGELLTVGSQFTFGLYGPIPNLAIYKLDAYGKIKSKNILNFDVIEKRQIFNKNDSTYRDTTYVYPGYGHAYTLKKTQDGNYLVGAFNRLQPSSTPEIGGPLLFKMDSNLQVLWHQNYYKHAINKDYPVDIFEESNGNIVLGIKEIYQGVDGGVDNIVYRVDANGVLIKEYYLGPCENSISQFRLNQNNQFEIAGTYGICKTDTSGKMISRSYYDPQFQIEVNGRNTYVDHSNNVFALIGNKSGKLCLIKYGYFGDDCLTYIKGKVYEDRNRNCTLDITDTIALQNAISFISNCRRIFTDFKGNYEMESDYGDNYTYMYVDSRYWKIGCEGNIKNLIHFDYPQSIKDSINIGLFDLDTCFYFEKYFDPSSQKSCSVGKYYYAMNNYGDTTIKNLDLIIEMPALTFNFSSNHNFNLNGNSLHFTFDSIVKRERISVLIQDSISCSAKIGDTLCYETKLEFQKSCSIDRVVYQDSICRLVRASFDPNYIEGYIRSNETCFDGKSYHNLLNYTIHFQNTGNSPANRVIIYDTLGRNLNFNSFKKGIASHPYTVEQRKDSILIFTFDSINLADSISDVNASKGLVSFQITGYYSDNNTHRSIEQQASIYFDHNSPIQTPIHTFDKCNTTSIIDYAKSKNDFKIYPNPTREYFMVECNLNVYDLKLFDSNGKLIMSKRDIRESLHRVELNHLNQGTYYVQIISGNRTDWKKLILMNID